MKVHRAVLQGEIDARHLLAVRSDDKRERARLRRAFQGLTPTGDEHVDFGKWVVCVLDEPENTKRLTVQTSLQGVELKLPEEVVEVTPTELESFLGHAGAQTIVTAPASRVSTVAAESRVA